MTEAKIIVQQSPYKNSDDLHVQFSITNGDFSGKASFRSYSQELEKIGVLLKTFPRSVPDEYIYEYGSGILYENKECFFKMKIYTLDSTGLCAMQFDIDLNQYKPWESMCRFSIHPVEPIALSKLGDLFILFSKLKHKGFSWSQGTQELFD